LFLKTKSYEIYSTANSPTAISIQNFRFTNFNCLIIGSEGHGISSELLSISDKTIKIDIDEQVAHLNAANAAAIFCYQLSLLNKKELQ
jgi:TrmH family RNA methyltransferase